MPVRPPGARRWLAALIAAGLASGVLAQPATTPPPPPAPPPAAPQGQAPAGGERADPGGLFDQLFGTDPAAERAGAAADGLALPALFAGGAQIADAIALADTPAGPCVALTPLLDALELAHAPAPDGGIGITLPEPRRTVTIMATALQPAPGGRCLLLAEVPRHLPLRLVHDPVAQRLLVEASAPLPVLMRLARAARQGQIRAETSRPAFPRLPRPHHEIARLWSADLSLGLNATNGTHDLGAGLLASGVVLGLAARAAVQIGSRGPGSYGITLSDAREEGGLLGPLDARAVALGDVTTPAQPLIAEALSGRGLVIASRPPWRADLVDMITLEGPLSAGWEAELWHEDRLVAVSRGEASPGQWRFGNVPVRLGENRWRVRLYGPHGETEEQIYTRQVGSAMNAENEVDYAIGFIDGGTPLLGQSATRSASGAAAMATLGWGLSGRLTARLDVRAPLAGAPALALGLHGAHAGTLWAATMAHDGLGPSGALRLARRLGAADLIFDWAHHGGRLGPALPAQAREFADLAALSAQGRLALGRFSLPWQLRASTATRRAGGRVGALGGRLALPLGAVQASSAISLSHQAGRWTGNAGLGLSAAAGRWRLRAAADAVRDGGWRAGTFSLGASRSSALGSLALDLGWQAGTRRLAGGLSWNRRLGPLGLSAGVARGGDGWRLGLGLTMGLWRGGGRWQAAPAGLARSGAVMADLFIDDDGDGQRGAGEAGVAGGRFIVANTLRQEETGQDGRVLLRGLPPGPAVDVETQLSSLPDMALRPALAGQQLALRPGEVRRLAVPLHPTGSIEVRVLLAAGDARTPLSNVPVAVQDAAGHIIARTVSDFDGYALLEGLAFGQWQVVAGDGQASAALAISKARPDVAATLLVPAA